MVYLSSIGKHVYIYGQSLFCFQRQPFNQSLPGHLRVYKVLAQAFNYELDNGMLMKSA